MTAWAACRPRGSSPLKAPQMRPDYSELVAEGVRDGHRRYVAGAKGFVGGLSRVLAEQVAEQVFSEPLVFAALSGDASSWLDQLVCGYVGGDATLDGLDLRAGPDGTVYVPGVGSWTTGRPDESVTARRPNGGPVGLYVGGQRVDVGFRPVLSLRPTEIELFEGGHPLLSRFYVDESGATVDVRFAGLAEAHGGHLERALEIIVQVLPTYAELMLTVTRKVVLHEGDLPNSFATPQAYGAVFLNMALGDDEVFLVEDLVHQCGHLLFSAASLDRERWFSVDPETPLKSVTGNARDDRSLYVALHGVFTEAAIVDALDRWQTAAAPPSQQQHELTGRLAFTLRRLAADLRELASVPVLAPDGRELVRALIYVCQDVASRRGELLRARFDNQAYNFDYRCYKALNPPPVATGA